jgi:hypothetical protein
MVLGALLAGACFGRVPGALDTWAEATKGFNRPLVLIFMGSSVGFSLPQGKWYEPDAIYGGLLLLAFSIIAKPGISFCLTYLLWPGQSATAQSLQVRAPNLTAHRTQDPACCVGVCSAA